MNETHKPIDIPLLAGKLHALVDQSPMAFIWLLRGAIQEAYQQGYAAGLIGESPEGPYGLPPQ